jgi:hypothetical protein
LAEQSGAEAGSLERPAELDDERDHVHARARHRGSSPKQGLRAKGRETDEARRAGSLGSRYQRAMPQELEEILGASRQAPAPAANQLTADAKLAGDCTFTATVDLDRDHGLEDELDRMNLSRDRVAGEDALALPAVLAEGQDHGEQAVDTVQGGEPASHPGLGELDARAAAACTLAAAQELVRFRGNGDCVAATLDRRYVNHVLLDDLAEPDQSSAGSSSTYAEWPPVAPQGSLAARERYEWAEILSECDSRQTGSPSRKPGGVRCGALDVVSATRPSGTVTPPTPFRLVRALYRVPLGALRE